MDSESELLCVLAAVIIQRKKTSKKKRKHRVKVQRSDWVTSQNFNANTYHIIKVRIHIIKVRISKSVSEILYKNFVIGLFDNLTFLMLESD